MGALTLRIVVQTALTDDLSVSASSAAAFSDHGRSSGSLDMSAEDLRSTKTRSEFCAGGAQGREQGKQCRARQVGVVVQLWCAARMVAEDWKWMA
jgi:hypothetical protein